MTRLTEREAACLWHWFRVLAATGAGFWLWGLPGAVWTWALVNVILWA